MKIINKSIFFIIIMFLMSCTTENDTNNSITNEENQIEEPIQVLNFVNSQKIADTPVERFDSHIVHENKLFSLSDGDTYLFDFESANWTLLSTDNVLSDYEFGVPVINFIRNGKWNMFTEKGLFEFDFVLLNWTVIKAFPQVNGLFTTAGFYIEDDNAIYFIDKSNRNDTIYKFDLLTNELLNHGEYVNEGDRGTTYNSALALNNSYYHMKQSLNGFSIFRFSEDFTDLSFTREFASKNDFSGSIAMSFENYIIFGLGGSIGVDTNGLVIDDDSTLEFYAYDTIKNVFSEMRTPFYESCKDANVVTYNNEFYLINGRTVKDEKSEARNIIEKIEFDFITL